MCVILRRAGTDSQQVWVGNISITYGVHTGTASHTASCSMRIAYEAPTSGKDLMA